MHPLPMQDLKQSMTVELERRRCKAAVFSYAQQRGGSEALYGLIGAVNILDALGLPLGDRSARAAAAARILAWRGADGRFDGGSGPGHALHMVVGALNLLRESVPEDMAPLAPTDPKELVEWLNRHDWQSTHKELCGQTIPLLASGRVSPEWVHVLVREIAARLSPARPMETWCAADAPSWRVISCVFHVLSAFDAGRIPYPRPELLIQRLFDLRWEDAPDGEQRTFCTDGDWAWLLLRLSEHLPHHAERVLAAIRKVSARRVRAWQENREAVLIATTHELYCYLWSTAVFQSCVREHYAGGFVRDTFNDPALFRL
jgi:hypothetical protein